MLARLAAIAFTALAAACATAPAQRLPDLAAEPAAFEMNGRVSVRVGDRSDIAKLRWTHRAGQDLWVVSSPLGNEVARIESGAAGASLERAGGPPERAPTFAALTEKVLGVALDPNELRGWLHGNPPHGTAAGAWKVTIEEKQDAGRLALARRITASRGDTVVKLVVDGYRALGD